MADERAAQQGLEAIAAAIQQLARGVNRVAAALESQLPKPYRAFSGVRDDRRAPQPQTVTRVRREPRPPQGPGSARRHDRIDFDD